MYIIYNSGLWCRKSIRACKPKEIYIIYIFIVYEVDRANAWWLIVVAQSHLGLLSLHLLYQNYEKVPLMATDKHWHLETTLEVQLTDNASLRACACRHKVRILDTASQDFVELNSFMPYFTSFLMRFGCNSRTPKCCLNIPTHIGMWSLTLGN